MEAAALLAQRWILAALRHRVFHHLEDLNAAIAELLAKLNERVMRHVRQSRRALYERLDRPALKALPTRPYQCAEWKQVCVNIYYHVSFEDHLQRPVHAGGHKRVVRRHPSHDGAHPQRRAHHQSSAQLPEVRLQRARGARAAYRGRFPRTHA